MRTLTACVLVPLLGAAPLVPFSSQQDDPPPAQNAAVERAVRDQVEALYLVQPELIERGVHPALEKYGTWRPEGDTEYRLPGKLTFEQLIALSGHWNAGGREGRTYEIEVLDALDLTANAKLTADWGIESMHLIKREGTWKIAQVLWQSTPPAATD